jgi:LmbE family N-acetylglucosaminyl deacetylase
MALVVDQQNLGPTEDAWDCGLRQADIAPLRELHPGRVVVIAPHPDDEILGAGGLLQSILQQGISIEIVAVTDGEASHPALDLGDLGEQVDLRSIRAGESNEGLRRLGWDTPVIRRLGLPDGNVQDHFGGLCEFLETIIGPDDLCLAPWRNDGHPDHDACGEAARLVARSRGADLLQYLVWAWHWADPFGGDLPWDTCRQFDLSRRASATKRWASSAFLTQIRPLATDQHDVPVLPPAILRRFWRRFELFVDEDPGQ